jgi:hypothetical protein
LLSTTRGVYCAQKVAVATFVFKLLAKMVVFSDFLLNFPCALETFGEHYIIACAKLDVSFWRLDKGFFPLGLGMFLVHHIPMGTGILLFPISAKIPFLVALFQ